MYRGVKPHRKSYLGGRYVVVKPVRDLARFPWKDKEHPKVSQVNIPPFGLAQLFPQQLATLLGNPRVISSVDLQDGQASQRARSFQGVQARVTQVGLVQRFADLSRGARAGTDLAIANPHTTVCQRTLLAQQEHIRAAADQHDGIQREALPHSGDPGGSCECSGGECHDRTGQVAQVFALGMDIIHHGLKGIGVARERIVDLVRDGHGGCIDLLRSVVGPGLEGAVAKNRVQLGSEFGHLFLTAIDHLHRVRHAARQHLAIHLIFAQRAECILDLSKFFARKVVDLHRE